MRLTSTKQVPTKPGEVPAAGHDMDFSARVKGTEVPHDILRQDLAKAYGDAVNATIDPASLGKDNVVPSSYQGSDGIGSYPGEVDKLLKHAGSRPHDPHGFSQQLGKKVYDPYASSYELAKDGKFGSAEASKYEAYRQLKKIGGKLASDRVSARGGTLDPHVQESLRIVECLGKKGPDGKPITPADIDAALRVRGETLETLTRKVESNIVGVEVLKGPGKGVPDQVRMDTFVETVKGKMELKKMEQHARASETGQFKPINPSQQKGNASLDPTKTGAFKPISGHSPLPEGGISSFQEPTMADTVSNLGRDAVEWVGKKDQALGDAIGLGDLPASAGAARRGINAAGQTAGQALLAYEGGKIAWNTGEAIAHYVTGDEEKAREKGLEAAYGGLSLGAGMVAAGTAPVATGLVAAGAGGVYSYNKTRELLETTETGRKVDKAVEDSMDSGWRAAEDLGDQLGGLLGYETEWEQEERQITNRQRSYLKALDNRQISLRDGVMVEDLMNYVKTSNPADPDYRKKMNTLIEGSAKNGMRENTSEPLFATPRTHFTDSANSFDKVRGGEEGFNPTINKHKENSDGFPEINQKDSQPLEIGTAEEKSGVFGEIGRERGRPVSHAKAHEKAVSEFANVGDPEALAAIRGAEKFRRNNPGPAAWELILQEELRKGEQRRQQMMQELSGTMSTIAQATAQSAQSLNPPKQQSSYDKSLEDAARHYGLTEDRDPYKKYRPWLNEINERKAREQENLAGHAMSSTAKTVTAVLKCAAVSARVRMASAVQNVMTKCSASSRRWLCLVVVAMAYRPLAAPAAAVAAPLSTAPAVQAPGVSKIVPPRS